jgi:glycosyltransferase involved in cell wall biosynthesis
MARRSRRLPSTCAEVAAPLADLRLRLAIVDLIPTAVTSHPSPQLSVIIASHDQRGLLSRCLRSLCAQTADPADFEVIVAGDGCGPETEREVASLEAPFALRYLPLAKAGKSAALNAAIEVAAGRTCLFLDDDILAAPQLVAGHLAGHAGRDLLGIGQMEQTPPQVPDWFAEAFARAAAEHYEELLHRPPRWTDCYGANFSAPTRALREIGGFRVGMAVGEDFEIALRLCQAGCTPTYLPDALGIHDDGKRRRRMLEDATRQGAAHVELVNRNPETWDELLSWEAGADRRELALRRLLLALRVRPELLALAGRFLPGAGRRMQFLHFTRRLAFWRGVKGALDPAGWSNLTLAPGRTGPALAAPLPLLNEIAQVVPL